MILESRSNLHEWRVNVGTMLKGKYTTIASLIHTADNQIDKIGMSENSLNYKNPIPSRPREPADPFADYSAKLSASSASTLSTFETELEDYKVLDSKEKADLYGKRSSNYVKQIKIYELNKREIETFKREGYAAIADIIQRLSFTVHQRIKVSDQYEDIINIGDAPLLWDMIMNSFNQNETEASYSYAKSFYELAAMKQKSDESIITYAERYLKVRNTSKENKLIFKDSPCESFIFILSLNDQYRNAVTNEIKTNND